MNEDEVDIDPEDPDNIPVFVQGDKRKFHSTNPWDVIEHDRALAEFEKRQQARIEAQNTETKMWFGSREVHVDLCQCSYCGKNGYDRGMKLGLNIPPNTFGFNAYWVYRKEGPNNTSIYYRCTPFSFLRKPQLWWRKNATRTL